MGGLTSIEYLFPDEFIIFAQTSDQVILKKKASATWREIPFPYMSTRPETTTSNKIAPYSITLPIKIIESRITRSELSLLNTIQARGCVIRYTTAEGQREIIGSPEHPLYGSINRVVGKSAKDYTGYELNLTGSSIHPPLPYSEV